MWTLASTLALACGGAPPRNHAAQPTACRRSQADASKLRALLDERVAATNKEAQSLLDGASPPEQLRLTLPDGDLRIIKGSTDCSKVASAAVTALAERAVAAFWATSRRERKQTKVSMACRAGRVTALSVSAAFGIGDYLDRAFLVEGASLRPFGPEALTAVTDLDGDALPDYLGFGWTIANDGVSNWPFRQLRSYRGAQGSWVDVPGLRWAASEGEPGGGAPLVLLRPEGTCVASELSADIGVRGLDQRHCWKDGAFRPVASFGASFEQTFDRLASRSATLSSLVGGDGMSWLAATNELAECANAPDDDANCAARTSKLIRNVADTGVEPAAARDAVMLAAGRTACPPR